MKPGIWLNLFNSESIRRLTRLRELFGSSQVSLAARERPKKTRSHQQLQEERKERWRDREQLYFCRTMWTNPREFCRMNLVLTVTTKPNLSPNWAFTRLLHIQIQFFDKQFTEWFDVPTRNRLRIVYYAGSKYTRGFAAISDAPVLISNYEFRGTIWN